MEGWLFDKGHGILGSSIFSFGGLLESLLSETLGSVKGYQSNDESNSNEMKAVRGNFEYKETDIVAKIQSGIFAFIDEISNSPISCVMNFSPAVSFENADRFGNKPRQDDLEKIGRLSFVDDSYSEGMPGDFEKGSRSFIESIMSCNWKTGCLKMRFGRWIPASEIYSFSFWLRDKGIWGHKLKTEDSYGKHR